MSRDELLGFIRSHRYAVEATVSPAAVPQAAVVGFGVTDRFEIVFDTTGSTRKARNLVANPAISLVIGGLDAGGERTIQVDGVADQPSGDELARLKESYYRVFPDGVQRATSWPGLTYFRVRPRWIRYSDFSTPSPVIVELTAEDLPQVT